VNSGFTAMKSIAHFFEMGCKQIETAFFAKREHLNYPVLANYVGLSIATTLKDHVYFDNSNSTQLQIYLA
jgi:pyrimidine operon attenuation protein/uracil phosphoribosyltransferase